MEKIPSFNSFIEKSIIDNWDLDALTDYQGVTLQYKDVARKIEKLHIMFENSGVVKVTKLPSVAVIVQTGLSLLLQHLRMELLLFLFCMNLHRSKFII